MATTAQKTTTKSRSRNGSTANKNDELAAEIEALRADITTVAEQLQKVAGAGARTARRHSNAASLTARETTDNLIADLTGQLDQIERKAGVAVKKNPLQSLAIAAGAGFLAALLMRR